MKLESLWFEELCLEELPSRGVLALRRRPVPQYVAGMPSGLWELYRATLKPKDLAFNVYVCRPVAALFVYALQGTRVAPNQVTFFSLLVAIGAEPGAC